MWNINNTPGGAVRITKNELGDLVVPSKFVRLCIPELNSSELSLLLFLCNLPTGSPLPRSIKPVSKLTSMDSRSVRTAYKTLEHKGYIKVSNNMVEILDLDLKERELNHYPNCWRCGNAENASLLEVHHLNRDRDDNRPENLVCLCLNCHALDTRGILRISHIEDNWAIRKFNNIEALNG